MSETNPMKNVSNSIVKKHLRFSKNVVTLRPLRLTNSLVPLSGGTGKGGSGRNFYRNIERPDGGIGRRASFRD